MLFLFYVFIVSLCVLWLTVISVSKVIHTALFIVTKYLVIWGLQSYGAGFFISTALLCSKNQQELCPNNHKPKAFKTKKGVPYFALTAGNELWFPDICELASKQWEKNPCKSKMHIKETKAIISHNHTHIHAHPQNCTVLSILIFCLEQWELDILSHSPLLTCLIFKRTAVPTVSIHSYLCTYGHSY